MKIWRLITKSDNPVIMTTNEDDSLPFNGEYIENYVPVEMYTLRKGKANYDAVYFTYAVPVVNDRTKRLMEPLLGKRVQFCELIHEKGLWAINVINVIDCFDRERSVYDYASSEKIGYVSEVFLLPHLIDENALIFKIPEQITRHIYVTQPFIDFVKQHKIKGFDFIETWDSEYTIEKEQELKQQYETQIAEINSQLDEKLDWSAISPLLEQGRAFISDVYKIQYNTKGELVLGNLQFDLTYSWAVPIYLPPIILDFNWCEVEPEKL